MEDADPNRRTSNFVALSPLDFLTRLAEVTPGKVAVIHEDVRIAYGEFRDRAIQLAGALVERGVSRGDVVRSSAQTCPRCSMRISACRLQAQS